MIDAAISHIAIQLNQHLKSRFGLHEDVVVISNILEQDGSLASHINNKLVMFLINIERDTTPQRPRQTAESADRNLVGFPISARCGARSAAGICRRCSTR